MEVKDLNKIAEKIINGLVDEGISFNCIKEVLRIAEDLMFDFRTFNHF